MPKIKLQKSKDGKRDVEWTNGILIYRQRTLANPKDKNTKMYNNSKVTECLSTEPRQMYQKTQKACNALL